MQAPKPIVNLDELPLSTQSRGSRFGAATGEFGLMLGLYIPPYLAAWYAQAAKLLG